MKRSKTEIDRKRSKQKKNNKEEEKINLAGRRQTVDEALAGVATQQLEDEVHQPADLVGEAHLRQSPGTKEFVEQRNTKKNSNRVGIKKNWVPSVWSGQTVTSYSSPETRLKENNKNK